MAQQKATVTPFLDEDFLLQSDIARQLYHEYAAEMPIIDYHCHLSPKVLSENKNFVDLTDVWLAGDHYKWRAMRTLGINERYITGDASNYEKFEKWAETVPYTMRNPLYHWTHLELQRYFNISELLQPSTARSIYTACNTRLSSPAYTPRAMVKSMNVQVICTTDDPTDDLQYHRALSEQGDVQVFPAFRPDKAVLVQSRGFRTYVAQLEKSSGISISCFTDLVDALQSRIEYFSKHNCSISDHGLERISSIEFSDSSVNAILHKALREENITDDEAEEYASAVLYHLGKMYHEKGWVMQFHLGALRNTNQRMAREIGPDTGFDSIGEWPQAASLARYLDKLDNENSLTKTILYGLNPKDNPVLATMIGNYNDGSVRGKMQFGSAWWYLDQKDGMQEQMNILSNMGLLSCFIGMLTDSRSFLSYPRHEYFRRILCNLFGQDVVNGELPKDIKWLGKIIQDICYFNAKNYFNFN